MWVFTNYGFFSFTQSTYRPGFIQIRARDDRDLEDLKERHGLTGQIVDTDNSDYRWRILCRPATAARIMMEETMAIDYSNFKNSTTDRQHRRPLMSVWSSMMSVQRNRERELGIGKPRYQGPPSYRVGEYPDHDHQAELFDDGTIDEDEEEFTEWRRNRRIHEEPLPGPFEPSTEEAAEFGDVGADLDEHELSDAQRDARNDAWIADQETPIDELAPDDDPDDIPI